MALVPPQQQRHVVQQSQQLRRMHWSLSSLASFGPCWGEDGFIFGRRQLSSIVLVYPCYKTMMGTHPCLVTGLHNPPAAFILKRDHDLPFVEQRCIVSRELWQTSSGKLMNSLSPTQQAGHEHTPRLMLKSQCETKKRPQITARGSFKPRQRQEPMDTIAIEGHIQSQFPASRLWFQALALETQSVWQSVWVLPLASGWAGGGNCRRNGAQRNPFANLAVGVLQAQGQRPGLQ